MIDTSQPTGSRMARGRSRNHGAWRVALLALVVLGATALLALALIRRPVVYRRYVGAPLKDGTRYTFVYDPKGYVIHRRLGSSVNLEDKAGRDGPVTVFLRRIGLLSHPHALSHLYIMAGTTARDLGGHSLRTVRDLRPYAITSGGPPPRLVLREVRVYDAPSRHEFWLAEQLIDPVPTTAQEGRMVLESFRVLAPGEAAPN